MLCAYSRILTRLVHYDSYEWIENPFYINGLSENDKTLSKQSRQIYEKIIDSIKSVDTPDYSFLFHIFKNSPWCRPMFVPVFDKYMFLYLILLSWCSYKHREIENIIVLSSCCERTEIGLLNTCESRWPHEISFIEKPIFMWDKRSRFGILVHGIPQRFWQCNLMPDRYFLRKIKNIGLYILHETNSNVWIVLS